MCDPRYPQVHLETASGKMRVLTLALALLHTTGAVLRTDADPSEQLQNDLNAAIAAGSSSFAISPGVYRPVEIPPPLSNRKSAREH